VRSGEEGGNLADVLNDLGKHLARSARLRGQVLGALIYPGFLLLLGATAVFVLTAFVIPRFQELFESFGQDLPRPTRLLIALSSFMSTWWWAVLAGLAAAMLSAWGLLRRAAVRLSADRLLLRLPVVGPMFLKVEISRIARTLSALVGGGVAILSALRITGETVRNLAVRATFGPMISGVSTGQAVATAASKAGLYPPLMINLIRTGEDTGELPEMLTELAGIYEEEAERAVSGAVRLLEPALIVVMGAVITGIVAAVMLPVFQANAMVE
jgi:general secretion pathway protein F